MDENRSKGHDCPNGLHERGSKDDRVRFVLRGEVQILQSITASVPLPELLNRICSALDCEIGNVVSLVSLLEGDPATVVTMAGNARHFGLYSFCSREVSSENHKLLGTLEMYSCDPRRPTYSELDVIERAASLAAIAIERRNTSFDGENAMLVEMRVIQKLDSPEIVN